MTKKGDEMLTFAEAAEIAECDPSTLRHAVRKGRLTAKKFGNTWAVTRANLEAWINSEEIHKTGPRKKGNPS